MNWPQVAIFGSVARGSEDAASDYDVIAVVESVEALNKERMASEIGSAIGHSIGLSIYSKRRLQMMWEEGAPFAWHLYLEGKPVEGFDAEFLSKWGAPATYRRAMQDSLMMQDILHSSVGRLHARVVGAECYEAGLVYVAARNTGMFSSLVLAGKFDFSRYAPYVLSGEFSFPLHKDRYSLLVRARHASTRGLQPPELDVIGLGNDAERVLEWSVRISNELVARR